MRNNQQMIFQGCVAYSIINNFDRINTTQCETIIKDASVCSLLPLTCANNKICSITDYNCWCQELEPVLRYEKPLKSTLKMWPKVMCKPVLLL